MQLFVKYENIFLNLPQKGLIRGDTDGQVFNDLKSHPIYLRNLSPLQIQSNPFLNFGTTNKFLQQQSKLIQIGQLFGDIKGTLTIDLLGLSKALTH